MNGYSEVFKSELLKKLVILQVEKSHCNSRVINYNSTEHKWKRLKMKFYLLQIILLLSLSN